MIKNTNILSEQIEQYTLNDFLNYLIKEDNNTSSLSRKRDIATGLGLLEQFVDDIHDSIDKVNNDYND